MVLRFSLTIFSIVFSVENFFTANLVSGIRKTSTPWLFPYKVPSWSCPRILICKLPFLSGWINNLSFGFWDTTICLILFSASSGKPGQGKSIFLNFSICINISFCLVSSKWKISSNNSDGLPSKFGKISPLWFSIQVCSSLFKSFNLLTCEGSVQATVKASMAWWRWSIRLLQFFITNLLFFFFRKFLLKDFIKFSLLKVISLKGIFRFLCSFFFFSNSPSYFVYSNSASNGLSCSYRIKSIFLNFSVRPHWFLK